jgi:two-component sensor histidine kinase
MKLFRFFLSFSFYILTYTSTLAQEDRHFFYADSLMKTGNTKEAQKQYRQILKKATLKEDSKLKISAYLKLANSNFNVDKDTAQHYYSLAIAVPKDLQNLELIGQAHLNLGSLYSHRHIYEKSLENYQEAATFYHAAGKDSMVAIVDLNRGADYKRLSDYDKATEFLLKAENGFLQYRHDRHLSSVYQIFANVLREQKRFSESIKYHQKGIDLRKSIPNYQLLSGSYNDLGNTFRTMGKLDSALIYYQLSLHLKDSLQSSPRSLSKAYSNIGETFIQLGQLQKADDYLNTSLNLKKEVGDQYGEAYVLTQLGELSLNQKDYRTSLRYLEQGLGLAKKGNHKKVIEENLRLHRDVYEGLKDFKQALYYAKKYDIVHEEIYNQRTALTSDNLKISYEVEKKEKELLKLYQSNELQQLSIGRQALINKGLFLLTGLLIVIAILLFFAFRLNKKNAVLQSTLLNDNQHRTKNFLQTLISLFSIQANELDDPRAKAAVKDGESRVNAMMMIHRYFSDPNLTETRLNFKEYSTALVEQIQLSFQKPGKTTELKLDLDMIMLEAYQSTPLALILNELVSNAFKYATEGENSSIMVSLKKKNLNLHLQVKDNGPGLPENLNIDALNSSGLKLVRLFVKQLKGELKLSNQGGFTCDVFVKI